MWPSHLSFQQSIELPSGVFFHNHWCALVHMHIYIALTAIPILQNRPSTSILLCFIHVYHTSIYSWMYRNDYIMRLYYSPDIHSLTYNYLPTKYRTRQTMSNLRYIHQPIGNPHSLLTHTVPYIIMLFLYYVFHVPDYDTLTAALHHTIRPLQTNNRNKNKSSPYLHTCLTPQAKREKIKRHSNTPVNALFHLSKV